MTISAASQVACGCNFKKPQMYYEYISALISVCVCVCVEKAACMKQADRQLLQVKIVVLNLCEVSMPSEMPL